MDYVKYDPKKVKIDTPKIGTKAEACITRIQTQELKELYRGKAKQDGLGVEIIAEGKYKDVPFRASMIFPIKNTTPEAIVFGTDSHMADFINKYDSAPAVGMMVEAIVKDTGYWGVAL